jgi:hypothetical protein
MSTFTGKFYVPSDEGFVEAAFARVFNHRRPSDRLPSAVLVAENEQDVVAGVRFAKENGLAVAVRSGGHSWAVWSVQNNTLLIDLGKLNSAEFDEATGIVSGGPAIQGGNELDPFLAERGRFLNGGHCPPVGIGGFLLQGGQGWCQRGWGWAAESVVAIDVVTADGELVRADENQNSDLYWAARGAGPSFPGIVTKFHLKTRPRFTHLVESVQVYNIDDFQEIMKWMYQVEPTISPDVEIVCVSLCPPSVNGQPRQRVYVVTGVALTDSVEAGIEALAPLQTCPIIDRAFENIVQESSMAQQREGQLRMNPENWRYYADNVWVDGETDDIIEALTPVFTTSPEPDAFTIWFGNGLMRELPDMAFSLQAPAYIATYLAYEDSANDARNRAWLNEAMVAAQPVTVGQYLGDSDMTNRQLRFMAPENFAKLQSIIATRDPEGRFVRYLAADSSTINHNHWQL